MEINHSKKIFLVTGAAGFIGSALVKKLIEKKFFVIGIDNINDYYDINLKNSRINQINKLALRKNVEWNFYKHSLEEKDELENVFRDHKPNIIVNLAAQAGVRYSLENPYSYVQSNLVGFANILELSKKYKSENLIFASSSSVYGGNKNLPFKESHPVDHPVSLYAATKRSNEIMAHTYSHLYGIPCTGLRFFTVYGPWGRPDMAPMIFANSILKSEPINIFNYGNMQRDFTFIDDIVESIYRCCFKTATPSMNFDPYNSEPDISQSPFRIFNIGNGNSIELSKFIELLEKNLGKKAIKNYVEMQPGDVTSTFADSSKLQDWIGYKPKTSIEEGVKIFVEWYKNYFL